MPTNPIMTYPMVAPGEKRPIWFDYAPELPDGLTITSVTAELTGTGIDLDGDPEIGTLNEAQDEFTADPDGLVVQQMITVTAFRGLPFITFTAVLSNGDEIPRSGLLPIGYRT